MTHPETQHLEPPTPTPDPDTDRYENDADNWRKGEL